jgi:nicotinamidase-related amidase
MKCLILVDFQNEWLDSTSDYYVGNIDNILDKANGLIDWARKNNIKIIFTRHIEPEPANAFSEKSNNSKITSKFLINQSDVVVIKNKISPFYKTNLEKEIDGIDEIIVAGILTNLCVRSLVADAYDRDLKITIIDDCCAAFTKEIHNFTLKDLKETRPEIQIVNLNEFTK